MHSVHYQRWNPPLSPVRIEIPEHVLLELAVECRSETRGYLYGLLLGGELRVLAARKDGETPPLRHRKPDEHLVGLEKIGIFIRRAEGEVFLAEPDLERFESQRAAVALVIAGERAGFFVRQADGSIQAIRSHEEFALAPAGFAPSPAPAPCPSPAPAPAIPIPRKPSPQPRSKQSAPPQRSELKAANWPRTATLFLAIPLAGLAYFRPHRTPPVQLRLTPMANIISISWNPAAAAQGGALEILDGTGGAKVEVHPGQASLSYTPHSGRLEVHMTADGGDGPAQLDSAALTLDAPPQLASGTDHSAELRQEIEALQAEAAELRESIEQGAERIASLQKIIGKLTHPAAHVRQSRL
jgi:hypothetical protein